MHLLCLKVNLLIASVLGFIEYKLPQKSSKWLQFCLALYYNTYFVTIMSLFLIYLGFIPSIFAKYLDVGSFNENIPKHLLLICGVLYHSWNITYTGLVLNLRFTFGSRYKILQKLYRYHKMKSKTTIRDYGLFIFNFGLKSYFIIISLAVKEISVTNHILGNVVYFTIYYSASLNILNLIDISFFIALYIAIIMDTLEKKIWQSPKIDNIRSKNLLWNTIRKKVFTLKEITESIYNQVQLVLSVTFMHNFIFMFSFITKFVTESKGEFKEIFLHSVDFFYVFLYLILLDLPQKKVC